LSIIWLKITNIFNSRVDKIVKDATTINASLASANIFEVFFIIYLMDNLGIG